MIYPDIKDAVEIHNDIIENIGGKSGYNEVSIGYLASALEHVRNNSYRIFMRQISSLFRRQQTNRHTAWNIFFRIKWNGRILRTFCEHYGRCGSRSSG